MILRTVIPLLFSMWTIIFSTIIAEGLRKILAALIHPDQNKFLPKKKNFAKNIQTTLNILEYYEKHSDKQLALIFHDEEKAFDNLSWSFKKKFN